MSREMMEIWIRTSIKPPQAREDALSELQKAVDLEGGMAVLVGGGVTTSGRGQLAWWDGYELVTIPLSRVDLDACGVSDQGMTCQPAFVPRNLPVPQYRCRLDDLVVHTPGEAIGREPLKGTVRIRKAPGLVLPPRVLGFRATFFHPDFDPRAHVEQFSVCRQPLAKKGLQPFQFVDLFSDALKNLQRELYGPVAIFVQLCEADGHPPADPDVPFTPLRISPTVATTVFVP